MKNRSDNKNRSDKKRRNTAERQQQHKTVILHHHDFSTQKGFVPRYTANIDKMMNSDSIFIKFFKMKAPNFDITQLLQVQTATPKVQKHAWKVKVREPTEEF